MVLCGKCGAPINGGKFCSKCGTPIKESSEVSRVELTLNKKNKYAKKLFVGIAIAIIVVIAIFIVPHTVNEPCDWCNHRPSMEFKTSDGSKAYVCKDCSKDCAWCNKKATKHYENMLGMIVFVCNDCYKDVVND